MKCIRLFWCIGGNDIKWQGLSLEKVRDIDTESSESSENVCTLQGAGVVAENIVNAEHRFSGFGITNNIA